MTSRLDRLAEQIVARRKALVVAWLLVVAGLAFYGRHVDQLIDSSQLPADN